MPHNGNNDAPKRNEEKLIPEVEDDDQQLPFILRNNNERRRVILREQISVINLADGLFRSVETPNSFEAQRLNTRWTHARFTNVPIIIILPNIFQTVSVNSISGTDTSDDAPFLNHLSEEEENDDSASEESVDVPS